MVKYQDTALDRTFAALSDPTRRALLARLGETDGLSISELAEPFPMSLPAVMKHLDVLSDAGLVDAEQDRAHRELSAQGVANGRRHELAYPLPALLVQATRSPCRLC